MTPKSLEDQKPIIVWPAQCSCGHIFLEKYQFQEPNDKGEVGFCWCGFCRKKRMVKSVPISLEDHAAMRLAGEHVECLCDEFAHLVLHQAAELKTKDREIARLKKEMRWPAFLSREDDGDIDAKLDKRVEAINCYTDLLNEIDKKTGIRF